MSKSKSKGKGKGKGSGWELEGGTSFHGAESGGDPAPKRAGPRLTQDKDERFRRGRLKLADGKSKRLHARKMQTKVVFSGSILAADGDVDEGTDASDLQGDMDTSKGAVPRERKRSLLSVMQRFQKLIKPNHGHGKRKQMLASDGDSDHEDEGEDEEEDAGQGEGVSEDGDIDDIDDDKEGASAAGNAISVMDPAMDYDMDGSNDDNDDNDDGDDSDNGDDGDEKHRERAGGSLDFPDRSLAWFFTASSHDFVKPKLQLICEAGKFSLYGSLNEGAGFKSTSVQALSDVAGLPKLWKSREGESLGSPMSLLLLPHLSSYCDAFLDGRDYRCDDDFFSAILLHACIHLIKVRTLVLKHNTKLKKKMLDAQVKNVAVSNNKNSKKGHKAPMYASTKDMDTADSNYQDQGFARPRILILCPFRGVALRCVEKMLEIFGENTSVANLDKFRDEYGSSSDATDDSESSEADGADTAKKSRKRGGPAAMDDWKADFQQNIDDDFKIGIQVNPGHGKGAGADKGVYLRLFSDFFISDIIIASPLGLRFIIENGDKNSADFLSSIEIVVLHQADIVYMQNWDHVEYVLRHVNKLPSVNNDIDFSRVRPYFLDGHGCKHRQLIMTSHFNEPCMHASFREFGQSVAGTLRLCRHWKDGIIANVMRRINQVFQRIDCQDFHAQEEDRFAYFKEAVLGPMLRTNQKRTIIITPSYISYVRVRNELLRQNASAAFICEYSRESEISRGRSRFFHGSKDILLYSGRFHYFRRFQIRGANHIVFYSVPEYPHFYPELVNMVTDGENASSASSSCLVLFTRFEQLALERLVGKKRTAHLVTSDKRSFLFK